MREGELRGGQHSGRNAEHSDTLRVVRKRTRSGSKLPEANYRSGSWYGGFLSSRVPGVVCRCSAKWVAEKSEFE